MCDGWHRCQPSHKPVVFDPETETADCATSAGRWPACADCLAAEVRTGTCRAHFGQHKANVRCRQGTTHQALPWLGSRCRKSLGERPCLSVAGRGPGAESRVQNERPIVLAQEPGLCMAGTKPCPLDSAATRRRALACSRTRMTITDTTKIHAPRRVERNGERENTHHGVLTLYACRRPNRGRVTSFHKIDEFGCQNGKCSPGSRTTHIGSRCSGRSRKNTGSEWFARGRGIDAECGFRERKTAALPQVGRVPHESRPADSSFAGRKRQRSQTVSTG